ncbi:MULTISPECIES: hypothetical protein [Bosea]|uniref:DUF7007 domain-containing protein n=1 Tax=Bosea spartocytisi TaxID=2773451 RepID=A0A927EAL2_9HYPH|nr:MULTISPECIES: hypothetical protein [Bosea]MBD3847388.1 hypothetical protein [Bosea spartocytisi]
MSAPPSENAAAGTEAFPPVEFGRSSEGFPVARVGDNAFAMLPGPNQRHYLASGWRISRPLVEWRRSDFFGHDGALSDEAAFRARVAENAEHQRERKALGRREAHSRAPTPWGTSQGATEYAVGVICHSTAGHGGFHLSAERNRKVHPMLRVPSGYYEEDEAWAIVAITFPELFTGFERRCAEKTLQDSWPDAWEAIFATVLQPGESVEKDRRAFEREHATDWIVVSAITSSRQKGMIECVATLGRKRAPGTEKRRFLVPAGEYEVGRFGFVIDPDRHQVYGGPSDFVGWQGRAS